MGAEKYATIILGKWPNCEKFHGRWACWYQIKSPSGEYNHGGWDIGRRKFRYDENAIVIVRKIKNPSGIGTYWKIDG